MVTIVKQKGTDPRDHFWFLKQRDDVMNCCKNVDNMHITEFPNRSMLAICKKCGRKHRKMIAEPGAMGALFGPRA